MSVKVVNYLQITFYFLFKIDKNRISVRLICMFYQFWTQKIEFNL